MSKFEYLENDELMQVDGGVAVEIMIGTKVLTGAAAVGVIGAGVVVGVVALGAIAYVGYRVATA